MHHKLGKLAPASPDPLPTTRTRAEVDAEIAVENHAIANIEKAIQGPILLRTCAYCSGIALEECAACDESVCEDDAIWRGSYVFCPECIGLSR